MIFILIYLFYLLFFFKVMLYLRWYFLSVPIFISCSHSISLSLSLPLSDYSSPAPTLLSLSSLSLPPSLPPSLHLAHRPTSLYLRWIRKKCVFVPCFSKR